MERVFCLLCCICFSLLTQVAEPQEINEPCTMHDGKQGKCMVDKECAVIVNGLKNKTFKPKDIKQCGGFVGKNAVICCPSAEVPNRIFRKKYVEKCEEYTRKPYADLSVHILGGAPTDPGEFPHMAAIGFQSSEGDNKISYVCGGAIISERFILSAAHCFTKREFVAKTVKLGRASLIESEDDQNPHIDIPVKTIIKHPEYAGRKKYNDIALLELAHDIPFTYYARPACLHHADVKVIPPLVITGWGRVSSDTSALSTWLLKANITESNFNECKAKYDSLNYDALPKGLIDSQLCATGRNGEQVIDACQGDSGGPLQYKVPQKANHMHYIYGIVSFGAACGNEDLVGIYTRVSSYLDWIQGIVWP